MDCSYVRLFQRLTISPSDYFENSILLQEAVSAPSCFSVCFCNRLLLCLYVSVQKLSRSSCFKDRLRLCHYSKADSLKFPVSAVLQFLFAFMFRFLLFLFAAVHLLLHAWVFQMPHRSFFTKSFQRPSASVRNCFNHRCSSWRSQRPDGPVKLPDYRSSSCVSCCRIIGQRVLE